MTLAIGSWVRRARLHKWHLVESVIAGDAVTRCGRRMDRGTGSGGGLEVFEAMATRTNEVGAMCKRCEPDV